MVFKVKLDRCRSSSSSPTPVGAKLNRFDEIMLKSTQHRTPECSFDLCGPYRNNPRYDLSPISKPALARGFSQPRLERSWSLSPATVPLQKSISLPEFGGPGSSTDPPRKCKACVLERGADSEMVCIKCGVVATSVTYVSQARSKNCESSKDPTRNADDPPRDSAEEHAWRDGPEHPEDRKRRSASRLGGTHMSYNSLKRRDLVQAQNAVMTQAQRDAQALCSMNPEDNGRGQRLVCAMENSVIAKLSRLVGIKYKDVKRRLRTETIRINALAHRHEQVCREKACIYSLSQHNVNALAMSIAELLLSQLAGLEPQNPGTTTIAELTQGAVTEKEMERVLEELQQLQQKSALGKMPRLAMLSAVSFISKWGESDGQWRCDVSMPNTLRVPPSRIQCPDEFGKCTNADPGDVTYKLQRSLVAAIQSCPTQNAVKLAAGHQLLVPRVVEHACNENLPCDVIGVSILAATALKMKHDDPTLHARKWLLNPQSIAHSTMDAFVHSLGPLIELPPMQDEEPELFGAL